MLTGRTNTNRDFRKSDVDNEKYMARTGIKRGRQTMRESYKQSEKVKVEGNTETKGNSHQ